MALPQVLVTREQGLYFIGSVSVQQNSKNEGTGKRVIKEILGNRYTHPRAPPLPRNTPPLPRASSSILEDYVHSGMHIPYLTLGIHIWPPYTSNWPHLLSGICIDMLKVKPVVKPLTPAPPPRFYLSIYLGGPRGFWWTGNKAIYFTGSVSVQQNSKNEGTGNRVIKEILGNRYTPPRHPPPPPPTHTHISTPAGGRHLAFSRTTCTPACTSYI